MSTRVHPLLGEPFCPACHTGADEPCTPKHLAHIQARHGPLCACGAPLRGRAELAAELRAALTVTEPLEYDPLEAAAELVVAELEGRCRTCAALEDWLGQGAP